MAYDFKITAKKFGLSLLTVLIVGGASVWADNPYWLLALPFIVAAKNYWTNR